MTTALSKLRSDAEPRGVPVVLGSRVPSPTAAWPPGPGWQGWQATRIGGAWPSRTRSATSSAAALKGLFTCAARSWCELGGPDRPVVAVTEHEAGGRGTVLEGLVARPGASAAAEALLAAAGSAEGH